jgi:hypothetical protein
VKPVKTDRVPFGIAEWNPIAKYPWQCVFADLSP